MEKERNTRASAYLCQPHISVQLTLCVVLRAQSSAGGSAIRRARAARSRARGTWRLPCDALGWRTIREKGSLGTFPQVSQDSFHGVYKRIFLGRDRD